MANNSPTIVAASLSDDQLKKSIDSLVTHVDEAMKKMVQSTNNAVGEMEAKLKSLGSLKIDTGGSNDGGTGRRTQQHEKLTKAVNDASEAVSKETQKLQDLQQSLSGASDREQNFISQKERAASTISKENELLQRQEQELAQLKTQQQQLADAEKKSLGYSGKQLAQDNLDVTKYQLDELIRKREYYNNLLKESQRTTSAFESVYGKDGYGGFMRSSAYQTALTQDKKEREKVIDDLDKKWEAYWKKQQKDAEQFATYLKKSLKDVDPSEILKHLTSKTGDVANLAKAALRVQTRDIYGLMFGSGSDLSKYMSDTRSNIKILGNEYKEELKVLEALQKKHAEYWRQRTSAEETSPKANALIQKFKEEEVAYRDALSKTIAAQKLSSETEAQITTQKEKVAQRTKELEQATQQAAQATQQAAQASQQKAQIDAQVAAKEKEIAETKGRIATATREQSEAEKNASQAAKEKANIQSQVESQEKKVAEAKKQLTTATQQQAEVEKQSVQNIAQQTAARDKQIKKNQETAMSFDQIAAALDKARRTVSDFNTSRASGILPSSEDYKRYEQALARIVEYNDKLKQSALSRADANQWANVFDGKRVVSDLTTIDDRLKQLNNEYKKLEAESKKAFGQDLKDAFKLPTASLDDVVKKISKLRELSFKGQDQGFISQSQIKNIDNVVIKLRELRREMESKAVPQSVANYIKNVGTVEDQLKLAFARANKIPTDQIDLAQAKLERLQTLLRDMRERGILSNTQIASTEAEIRKLEQIIGQVNTAQQQTTQSAQRYTEEIRKQAQAIRESKQWKETGTYSYQIGNETYYVSKKQGEIEAQLVRHKEQQVNYQKEYLTAGMAVEQNTKQQAATEEKLVQAEQQRLGIEQEIAKARREYISPTTTTYTAPTTDMLRKFIASKAGVEVKDVKIFDETAASASKLQGALKQVQKAYSNMSAEERNSPFGQALIRRFQELQRESQKTQQQLSRPTSLKSVKGLDEKTLDDIAYKMQRLRAYRQGIDLTKPNAANEIKQVDEALAKLQKDADKWMSKSQQMIKSNTALGRSWNYMKNRLAFYFTVGASTQFVKNLIDIRSQYEMNERALGILINSAERGTQIFNELSQMALVSPYTLIELSTAAKQLTAYDIAAKDVVDTTRRLADMASAVGIPIERLTYALGQIKAYGYLNSRDARMFANAGIPLVKQLSDYYTQLEGRLVSTADVYDRIKKKTVDYEQVVQVINKMTDEGGKFFDFQAKMADTLKVRLANLTLAWNNMLNDMGSSNQGVLTTGIGLLRDMFLHWKDLESAIGKVAAAFGIYKTAQLATLIWTGRITTAMGVQELVGKKLQARFASLTVTQKGFVSVATAGWAALAFVVADAWLTISRNMEEIEQLNKSIADGAKESYEAIDKMLHSSEMVSTRLSAAQGKLSDTDAAKAWEMLREQIELSAASSKELIAQLLKEPDINKRVTESFNLAEKIEEANRKLSDLNDSLDVSQNSILGGLFGEGLAEDIDDYNARLKYTSDAAEWAAKKNKGFWENAAMGLRALFNEVKDTFGSDANEAQDEIKNFAQKAAQTIKDELGEEGIKDKIQVNEAIARVVRGMEQQFPQIRGKGKVLFETIFYDTMANEFKGAVDSQAYYYEKFLEQLKKDHASAFSGVTEDINKETFKWSSAQIDAIQKTADKVKKDLPAASQGAIDEILRQLNSTDFKVRIVAEMATTSLDNVQKQFREKFIEKPWVADDKEREKAENEANQRYGTLMRKNTESNAEYEKRISDEKKTQLELSQKNADIISKNQGKEEEYSKAVLADAKKQKEIADDRLKAINEIEDKGGYDFSTKGEKSAARKAAKQAESELAKALKDELSTIEKVRSIYKDLTKEGMSHANAVERATKGWDETVNAINRVLQKNGLQKLDLSKFAGIENPRELLNILQSQLETLVKRGASTSEIRVLQTKIQTVSVEADKYDLTMITKGLNNELGKLKDEYELAVELDANPELGNMFADMFGITPDMLSEMPHTVGQLVDKYQDEIDKQLKGKFNTPFNILKTDINKWVKDTNVDPNSDLVKTLTSKQNDARGMVKKTYLDIQKMVDDYVKEYGDQQQQIEQIEKEKKNALSQLNSIYYTDALRQTKEYLNAKEAIENAARIKEAKATFAALKKTTDYDRFFNAIDTLTSKDALAIKAKIKQGIIQAFKDGGLTVSEFRREIKALESQFDKLTESSSLWTNYLSGGFDKLIQKAKETGQEIETIGESISIKGTIDDKDKNFLQSMGNIFSDGNGGSMDFTSLMNKFGGNMKGLGEAVSQAGQGMQQGAGGFASAIAIIDMVIKNVHQTVQAIGSVIDELDSVRNEENKLSNAYWEGFKKSDSYAASGWENLKSGNIAGAVSDTANSLISLFNVLENAKNEKINAQIKESERNVKSLENSYKNLQRAIENAYGAQQIGARKAAIANKELQLVELQRQLALENSRSSKNRDVERITDLQGQIIDLKNELKDMRNDITNSFLGISSVSDAVNTMMDDIVDALRNGEDAMKGFDESIDNMIANMIKQVFSARILGPMIEKIWQNIDNELQARGQGWEAWLLALQTELGNVMTNTGDKGYGYHFFKDKNGGWTYTDNKWRASALEASEDFQRITYEEWKAMMEGYINQAQKALEDATTPQMDDIRRYAGDLRGVSPELEGYIGELENILREMGLIKDATSEQALSKLQQGISGITEDTAGAIEAYMNSVSQQVYLHSDLLTQIRDAVVGIDMDVQVATQAQMLLQLQQSYAVQMAIQGILEGWNNPSGQAVRVELVS